jgi:hypothetical protein
MADYATLRGPVGLNRVYASVPNGALSSEAWLASLRAGHTFATNGPLLDFSLDRAPPGATLDLEGPRAVHFSVRVHAIVPIDHMQIVCNGRVARELQTGRPGESLQLSGSIAIEHSGWCVLRAFTAHAEYPVLDNFVYATTSAVYLTVGGAKARSPEDASFFRAWVEHLRKVTAAYPDWNSEAEKAAVLRELDEAQAVYTAMQ